MEFYQKLQRMLITTLMVMCTFIMCQPVHAAKSHNPALVDYKVIPLPNDSVRIRLTFSKPLKHAPKSFMTHAPLSVAVDFKYVDNGIGKKSHKIMISAIESMRAFGHETRTRVVFQLKNKMNYDVIKKGNVVLLTFSPHKIKHAPVTFTHKHHKKTNCINSIDFRSLEPGSGKLVIGLKNPDSSVDVRQEGRRIVLDFFKTFVPESLTRQYDVKDFATPASIVSVQRRGHNTRIIVRAHKAFEQFAYQINNKFVVEVKTLTKEQQERLNAEKPRYKGKRITLNFQNIKVRAVLQLLADFTGLNIVVSDKVQGAITLRLKRVPWDQALDIILKTQGLAKRNIGSVILIAPNKEIMAREAAELKANQQVTELEPLHADLLRVKYAKAVDLAKIITHKENPVLSKRGSVTVDERTNSLYIQDTAKSLMRIRDLLQKLDIPVRQVLIEARVVTVDKNVEEELGVRFGLTRAKHVSGTLAGANDLVNNIPPEEVTPFTNRLNVDLPAVSVNNNVATLGIALARLGHGILLDLELSALESEGFGEVIASPRLITANQQSATIESGEEIPYQEATSSGATSVAFKKAVLSLQVTPQITPDNKIILALKVNQDRPSVQRFNDVPAIITKEIDTNVLVENGQTIVLGGIYMQTKNSDIARVPFLGSLPLVGGLFRNTSIQNKREELLIFVTPKIITDSFHGS